MILRAKWVEELAMMGWKENRKKWAAVMKQLMYMTRYLRAITNLEPIEFEKCIRDAMKCAKSDRLHLTFMELFPTIEGTYSPSQ